MLYPLKPHRAVSSLRNPLNLEKQLLIHENSNSHFQLPASQECCLTQFHIKSRSATSRKHPSSPPGHVEPWSRITMAIISVFRCHRRTLPRTAVSASTLHVGPSAEGLGAWLGAAAVLCALLGGRTAWAEGHRPQSAALKPLILTYRKTISWCTCRAQAQPAGAASVLVTLSSGSSQCSSPPDPSAGTGTLLHHTHTHVHTHGHTRAHTMEAHAQS